MANRYCDTSIQKKTWYRKLTPELKAIWKFFTDMCDHAGLWDIDQDAIKYYVGSDLTLEEILSVPAFAERFKVVEDKLFCPGFIVYQYRGVLNESNSVHSSVIKRLKSLGIDVHSIDKLKVLVRGSEAPIDKDIEIDKELEKEILKILDEEYPIADGFGPGIQALLPQIKTPRDALDLRTAAKHYKHYHIRKKTDAKWIPHPKTWALEWRLWIDADHGSKPESVNLQAEEHKKIQAIIAVGSTDEGLKKAMQDPNLVKIASRFGGKLKLAEDE